MNRAELVKTLELVKPALDTSNTVPIFQCFTFEKGTVSAYNDAIGIVGPSEFEWACGIHGPTLLGLLSNSKAEVLDISLERSTAILKLGSKTGSKLPYFPREDFIFVPPNDVWDLKMPFTESLFEAIKMCLETVSVDETQKALLGITIQGDKMYSCNSDSLTRVQLKTGIKGRVLLSTPFCLAVSKLWSTLSITKGTLHFNNEWVFADFGEWSVYGRILEIQDPIDFEGLIKKTVKAKVPCQPLPADFSESLSRARVLADPESQKTVITVAKHKIHMRTETHMGEINDHLVFKGHPDVLANVNASHLQRALEYCDQIAFYDNCSVLEKTPNVFMLVSNMN